MQKFEEIKGSVMNKKYDYLDHRNSEYDADFETFMWKIDDLKGNIANTIETNFENVWETPQGITFLTRFEMVCYLRMFLLCAHMICFGRYVTKFL